MNSGFRFILYVMLQFRLWRLNFIPSNYESSMRLVDVTINHCWAFFFSYTLLISVFIEFYLSFLLWVFFVLGVSDVMYEIMWKKKGNKLESLMRFLDSVFSAVRCRQWSGSWDSGNCLMFSVRLLHSDAPTFINMICFYW